MEGERATLDRFGSSRTRPPANKSKPNQAKLHTYTYMHTYTQGKNKIKQMKTTQDCRFNYEELIRPGNLDVSISVVCVYVCVCVWECMYVLCVRDMYIKRC